MPRAKRTITDALGRAMPLTRRGFGSIRQLPSGNWQASYIGPDDQRHLAPDTFLHRPEAEAWLAREYEAIKTQDWQPDREAEMFGPYAQEWVANRRKRNGTALNPRTVKKYYASLAALEHFDATPLDHITAPEVRRQHSRMVKQSGATTAGHHLRVMRAVLNTAYRDGIINRNPVPSELCSTTTGVQHRPPTEAELAELIKAIDPRFKLAVCLAAFGGLRLGEWRALRRRDLTAKDGRYTVTVERQAQHDDGKWTIDDTKSESGERQVALPTWLTPEIEHHLKTFTGKPKDALLFAATRGGDYVETEWTTAWNKARSTVGIKDQVRGHDLRHYYATSLAQAGASAPLLQMALGHADIAMSMKYVHAARGAAPELADLITRPTAA